MLAVTVRPESPGSATVADVEAPRREPEDCLVEVLEVGICGTDRDIDQGKYGEPPAGGDTLVIGHESLGRVVEAPDDSRIRPGDLVVATVRRPCPERCANCDAGANDFCSTGNFTERGIKGRHGYLAERYAERPEFLVPLPARLRRVGVLLEPLSVVEKAFRQSYAIQLRLRWEPRRVLVTGAGPVGILAASVARLRGLQTTLYSRGAPEPALRAILDRLGASYVDSHVVSAADAARELGAPDIVMEATGASALAWETAGVLAVNGVACLLSVTGGDKTVEIPSDRLNDDLVLGNRVVFGSVNASRDDFEQGVADLGAMEERFPGLLASLVTRRVPIREVRDALGKKRPGDLKTVVEVATGD